MTENVLIALVSGGTTIVGALIGFGGAILSGKVGGKKSYEGAMDAVTKQIQYQKDLIKIEEDKKSKAAHRIIAKLLWSEIDYNCRMFDGNMKVFSKDWFLRDKPTQIGYEGKRFIFDSYNEIKYELLKYDSSIVQDVVEIYYKMFLLSSHKDIDELSQKEFDRVKTLYILKDKIKDYLEKEE